MEETMKLTLLKIDLGIFSTAQDIYLTHLLSLAEKEIEREGIIPDGSAEYGGIQIQYAAYLFRRRASEETAMPRFLRYALNNLLMSQKAVTK